MKECTKCAAHGVSFRRTYDAVDFLEGYSDSPIWIVGLNPAAPPEWEDGRTIQQLQTTFYDLSRKIGYFRDFNRVSPWLYSMLGQPNGVAHTDLVKCSSKSWPPPGCSTKASVKSVVANCSTYLRDQIHRFRPRLIICNGAEVSTFVKEAIPPTDLSERDTSYRGTVGGEDVWVVLSGFIARIDNFARIRLGREIESIAATIGVTR